MKKRGKVVLHYLKPTIKGEPLIWRWYAWSYLIPPATAAANIVERHLKIMQSYVQNPQIHAQAVKDPKMLGGPFIDYKTSRVEEIKELIALTKQESQPLISLNAALKELDRILQSEAKGDTLEEIYPKIPDVLRGMIELVYDLNNHPSIRLIEPFFYKTYYTTNHQTIALSGVTSDFREFVLSTPRLDQEDEVYLNVAFSDKKLDLLFQMKETPSDLDEVVKMFDVSSSKQPLFESFFTTTPPVKSENRNYHDDGVRLRYFGHACILVQTKSVSILLDPVISYPIQGNDIPRYTFEDLPEKIDYVIITHNHQDHLMFETLLQLRYKIKHIIFPANHKGSLQDPSLRLILQHIGFESLIELNELQTIPLEEGEVVALPFFGEHSDLNIQTKLAYCIKLKDKTLMFAADSNNLDPFLYDHIINYTGSIDMLFLGMECDGAPLSWLYGPLLSAPLSRGFDKNRTLSGSNFEKAWTIVQKLQCKRVYIYAMGQEPWLNYIMALKYCPTSLQITESNKLIEACKSENIDSERLFGRKEWMLK